MTQRIGRIAGALGFAGFVLAFLIGTTGDPGTGERIALGSAVLLMAGSALAVEMPLLGVILVSTLSGGPRSSDLGGGLPFSLHGLFTGALFGGSIAALVLRRREIRRAWVQDWVVFLAFSAWVWLRLIGAPSLTMGISDSLIIATPVVIGLLARLSLEKGILSADGIDRLILWASAVPVLFVFSGLAFGFVRFSELGFDSPLGTRTLALSLMVPLALALSRWRGPGSRTERWTTGLWSLVLLLVVILSLSRLVVAITVGLFVPFALIRPKRLGQLFFASALGVVLVLAAFQLPGYQQRFLPAAGESEVIDTSRRSVVWPVVFQEALASPWIGHGTGSSRILSMQVRRWDHPHNDYLRVFHDQGLAGLGLFLTAWFLLVRRLWGRWLKGDSLQSAPSRRQGAALMLAAGILASFLTDNTLVYIFVMGPAFILFSRADFAAKDGAGGEVRSWRGSNREATLDEGG
jgi:hypothetical protein